VLRPLAPIIYLIPTKFENENWRGIMNKLAALSPTTFNSIRKALVGQADLNRTMIELGEHFKIDPRDAQRLLRTKMIQHPKTKLMFIDKTNEVLRPGYFSDIDTVVTYPEPWSFMHEYGHAHEKADIFDKLRRILPIKTIITPKQQELLDSYVSEAYMNGTNTSQNVGKFISKAVEDSKGKLERDTWRMNEELRANARAFKDTKALTGDVNAEKIMQPLSGSDISYVGAYYPDELAKLIESNNSTLAGRIVNTGIFKVVKDMISKVNNGLPTK
jgi:hypothetical protein